MDRGRTDWMSLVHLCTAFSIVIAQPLFDLFSRNAEFFVIRNSKPIDIFFLIFALSVLMPGAIVLILFISRVLSQRLSKGLQHLTFAFFGAVFALQVLKPVFHVPGVWLISGACGLGVIVMLLYLRLQPMRMFMTALSPALVLFPGLFIFYSPVYQLLFPKADTVVIRHLPPSSPPIVMVLFDEFPLNSLLDAERHIDDIRYPHFAALAREATWFRNATTVSPSTPQAIPAILTGKYPDPTLLPTAADHPHNLFTWLGGAYDIKAFGAITQLCPETLCPRTHASVRRRLRALFSDTWILYLHLLLPRDLQTRLPAISQKWMDFGHSSANFAGDKKKALSQHFWELVGKDLGKNRRQEFLEFVHAIQPASHPTLFFLHILLPHSPYNYFPSGKMYTTDGAMPGLDLDQYLSDEWAVTQLYRRHLLQVGFVDTLLGQLIAHLKEVQLYDRALLIVAADHGVSFNTGGARRELEKSNIQDILPVPLFIKAPQQHEGVISDVEVETIDILPTIASILGLNLPWTVDGQAIHSPMQPQRKIKMAFGSLGKRFEFSSLPINTQQAYQRQIRIFGARTAMTELYKTGPYKNIIGRPVSDVTTTSQDTRRIEVDQALSNITIDPQAAMVPAYITGRVDPPPEDDKPLYLALAVNNTVQAITRSWTFPYKDEPGRWAAVINEHAFRPGFNTLETFFVMTVNNKPVLVKPLTERYLLSEAPKNVPAVIKSSRGKSFSLVTGALEGWVDNASQDQDFITVTGWAADTKHGQPSYRVIAFINEESLFCVTPHAARPDVAAMFGNSALERSGFSYRFPSAELPQSSSFEMRFFALSREGVASELSYGKGYPWRTSAAR